jgi:OPA family glycerol-3-phosphate transporter-like MFS transporter 1/2
MIEEPIDEEETLASVGFLEAWAIPKVASFAFCLFFSKLVAYTFLYWLPFYIWHTGAFPVLPLPCSHDE